MSNFLYRLFFPVLFFAAFGATSAQAQTKLSAATKSIALPGQIAGVKMLYGTDSKVWKTAKETDASGDKVTQSDEQNQEELRIFANGTFNMRGANGAVAGKYTFDQVGKTFTMIFDGATVSNTFAVETLTDKKLTLKSEDGAALMLEAK